jgi:large exoprotein involved in heme utilization and adhesion
LGLEVRDLLTPNSDITAFSQQNPQADGTVQIEILRPVQQESIAPIATVTTEELLAYSCLNRTNVRGTFNLIGSRGLPLTPTSGFDRTDSAIDIPKYRISQVRSELTEGVQKG